MKQLSTLLLAGILCTTKLSVMSQVGTETIKANFITPYSIALSESKTTNLIFQFPIISVDRGSADILAQKANGVENVLQLKAAIPGIVETNLTVITSDNQFYSFVITYASDPTQLNFQIAKDSSSSKQSLAILGNGLNQSAAKKIAQQVISSKRFLHVSTKNQKVKLQLKGIFLKEKVMWFSLSIRNSSFVDYKPEGIRFFLTDLRRVKRTAMQSNEILPLYVKADSLIEGKTGGDFVIGFKPFTVPNRQKLVIQIAEEFGGRTLALNCSYKVVLQIRKLP